MVEYPAFAATEVARGERVTVRGGVSVVFRNHALEEVVPFVFKLDAQELERRDLHGHRGVARQWQR